MFSYFIILYSLLNKLLNKSNLFIMAKRSRKVLTKRSKRPRRSKSSSRKTMKRTKRQPSRKHTSRKPKKVKRKSVRKRKKTKKLMKGGVEPIGEAWYAKEQNMKYAETELKGTPIGSFMVRKSKGNYVLSFINKHSKLRHTLLGSVNDQQFTVNTKIFNTISEIINHVKIHRIKTGGIISSITMPPNLPSMAKRQDIDGFTVSNIGHSVSVRSSTGIKTGTIRFVGLNAQNNPIIGVEYNEPIGMHDGVLRNVRYFECDNDKGVLVNPTIVTLDESNKVDYRIETIGDEKFVTIFDEVLEKDNKFNIYQYDGGFNFIDIEPIEGELSSTDINSIENLIIFYSKNPFRYTAAVEGDNVPKLFRNKK
jgi:hypothetical protein